MCHTDDLKFPPVGTKDEMKEISVILLVMRAYKASLNWLFMAIKFFRTVGH